LSQLPAEVPSLTFDSSSNNTRIPVNVRDNAINSIHMQSYPPKGKDSMESKENSIIIGAELRAQDSILQQNRELKLPVENAFALSDNNYCRNVKGVNLSRSNIAPPHQDILELNGSNQSDPHDTILASNNSDTATDKLMEEICRSRAPSIEREKMFEGNTYNIKMFPIRSQENEFLLYITAMLVSETNINTQKNKVSCSITLQACEVFIELLMLFIIICISPH